MGDLSHSVLIVSASEKFAVFVRRSLKGFPAVDVRKSGAVARREIMERFYDLIIINAPLSDETGEEFALDAACECEAGILLVVPSEVYDIALERMTDRGIMVLSKPLQTGTLDHGIRFLMAVQNTLRGYRRQVRQAHEKLEDMRVIDKAKFLLVEKKHMSEDEAHRLIGKRAMDNSVSRRRVAEEIIEQMK